MFLSLLSLSPDLSSEQLLSQERCHAAARSVETTATTLAHVRRKHPPPPPEERKESCFSASESRRLHRPLSEKASVWTTYLNSITPLTTQTLWTTVATRQTMSSTPPSETASASEVPFIQNISLSISSMFLDSWFLVLDSWILISGTPWTEEEHRTFLNGLEKLGKGDWRGISRNFVVTKSPTQVASHAQKYFLRQATTLHHKRRRTSLFDMASFNLLYITKRILTLGTKF